MNYFHIRAFVQAIKNKTMDIHYQKSYDFTSTIDFISEESPGKYLFKILRREQEYFWDPEEDECCVIVEDGKVVEYDDYASEPSEEEKQAMCSMLKEMKLI